MKEIRYLDIDVAEMRLEVAEASPDKRHFVGYAARFNSPSQDLGGFRETIRPGTFAQSLKRKDDVVLLIDHEGIPVARSSAGTLRINEDDKGLYVDADVNKTSRGNDLIELLNNKEITKMSFAFVVRKDTWSENGTVRELIAADLHDVSAVVNPAYVSTDCALRSLAEWRSLQEPTPTLSLSTDLWAWFRQHEAKKLIDLHR